MIEYSGVCYKKKEQSGTSQNGFKNYLLQDTYNFTRKQANVCVEVARW